MKKLIIASLFAFSSFAFAAEYDFSSGEKFEASVYAQAKKEGLTVEQVDMSMMKFTVVLAEKYPEEMAKIATIENEEELNAALLPLFKKELADKNLKDVLPSPEKYDFSDLEAFGASVELQAKLEGLEEEVFSAKMEAYIEELSAKNAEELAKAIPADKVGTDEADAYVVVAILKMLKEKMGDKDLVEILEIK